MPIVSIIICTYNRKKLLSRAIDSVLKQNLSDFELIILDDASTDQTKSLIDSFSDSRIKYFKNNVNLGIVKSRNKACNIASAKYIAMLDSDDWWLKEDKLERQISLLESNPEIGVVGTGIVSYDENNNFIKETLFSKTNTGISKKILIKNQFNQSSVVFRKDAYLAAGGYDESLSVCEDFDLWLKIGTRYELANIKEAMTAFCVNPEGITKLDRKRVNRSTKKLIKKYKFDYPGYLKSRINLILK